MSERSSDKKRALPSRILPALFVLCAVFLTFFGIYFKRDKSWSVISFVDALLVLLAMNLSYERKNIGARRTVLTAVMTALAVAGRVILAPVPGAAPITPFAAIAAMYAGPWCGFATGSTSALISGCLSGLGSWTPFQMLAWGLNGFFAGIFAERLKKSRAALCVYCVLGGIFYSGLMDVWSVIWYNGTFAFNLWLAAAGTALPFTAVYCASNLLFLNLMRKPIGEKLDRVKVKYGI